MAAEITIIANEEHEYWVDIQVDGVVLQAQIDTGMTEPNCAVGVALGPTDFDRLAASFTRQRLIGVEVATGPLADPVLTAMARVSIDSLDGSEIETHIARLGSNLLGVCFFHRLPGFEVHWNLASRTMTIQRTA
jgi:predicted aspartyl protease